MPISSSVSALKRTIWRCPPIAISGAQGLAASAVSAAGRRVVAIGSIDRSLGIATGPAGLPAMVTTAKLFFGLLITTADPLVSGAPPAIQFLITAMSLSASLSPLGGMLGSSAQVTALNNLEESGSPGSTALPLPPPAERAP